MNGITTSSSSWRALRPYKNFDRIDDKDETESEYVRRLKPAYDIPLEVAQQWLYGLYEDPHTIQNYSWMNFRELKFKRVEFRADAILKLNVVAAFQDFVSECSARRGYDDFTCLPRDLDFWKSESTWRIPPIVLDVGSLPFPLPATADIRGPYQLIEGHSRLGNFRALETQGKLVSRKHAVYLLTAK